LDVVRFARCVALWFVIVLPMSPTIWALCAKSWTCFTPAWSSVGVHPVECLAWLAFLAPFAAMFGPLAGTVEEPEDIWPDILFMARGVALLITTLRLFLRRRTAN
jgi:hypothetical protein